MRQLAWQTPIADFIGIPRSLIYYYYKNKDDIMYEIYKSFFDRIDEVTNNITVSVKDPLIKIMVKYILHFKFIIQNNLLRDYILSRPTYVSEGANSIEKALDTCYLRSKQAFDYYNIPLNNNTLYAYVITCDALIHALFEGIFNGTLTISLCEIIMYFGERTVMPSFNLTKNEFSIIVKNAFDISEPIESI